MVRRWAWGWVFMFAAASAQAGDEGVTPTEIRLGASQVLSGPLGPQTVQYGEGARLLFDAVNAAGGIHGRKISYTSLDDGFDPKRAVENTRKLIEEQKVFMLFNSTGTAQTAAVLPLLKESKTILFGPVTGASSLREGANPYLFHVRAGYASETQRIVSQLKQIGVTRVAFFYQDDGLGKTLLGEIKKASAAENLPLVAEIKVDPAAPDFAAAAAATAQANPQAVIVGTAGLTFPKYVTAVNGHTGFTPHVLRLFRCQPGRDQQGAQGQGPRHHPCADHAVAAEHHRPRGGGVSEAAEGDNRATDATPSASQFEGFRARPPAGRGPETHRPRPDHRQSFTRSQWKARVKSRSAVSQQSTRRKSHNGSDYVELAIIDGQGQLRY